MPKGLYTRILSILSRGVLRAVDDSKSRQEVQASFLKGETRDRVERLQPYGLATHPHPGAEVFGAFIGGDRSQGLIIVADDKRYRVTGLQQGEVVLYDDQGNKISILRDKIQINAITQVEVLAPLVTITAPQINITGDITIAGNVGMTGDITLTGGMTATADVEASGISLASHVHDGSPTAPPGGVSDTGAPK